MAATLFRPKKIAAAVQQPTRNSPQYPDSQAKAPRNRTATTRVVPCIMAGYETARLALAHALDAHVYNFFKVLVFQQLSLSESLCFITLCHVLCCYFISLFINAYILLKLAQKLPQKSKIFLGEHAPRPP